MDTEIFDNKYVKLRTHNHTIAIDEVGNVWAWGPNESQQCGIKDAAYVTSPSRVSGIEDVVDVAVSGGSSLALKRDGTVWAWGAKSKLVPWNDSEENTTVPFQLIGLDEIISISPQLALKRDGTVWSWGESYYDEQWNYCQCAPVHRIQGLSDMIAVSQNMGGNYSWNFFAALKADGTVCTFAPDKNKNGDSVPYTDFTQIAGLEDVVAIEFGSNHGVALKSDGTVYVWGLNFAGQHGAGKLPKFDPADREAHEAGHIYDSAHPYTAVQVVGLENIVQVSAGETHSAALDGDGNVWSWGHIGHFYVIEGHKVLDPDLLATSKKGPRAVYIASGDLHNLYISDVGDIWGWGTNERQGLAEAFQWDVPDPVRVDPELLLKNSVSYPALENGMVLTAGHNNYGQLGNGTFEYSNEPVEVVGLYDVTSVCSGYNHCLALKDDGTVWAWGDNSHFQLGAELENGETYSCVPVRVRSIGSIKSILASVYESFAVGKNGTLWKWGGGCKRPVLIPDANDVKSLHAFGFGRYGITGSGELLMLDKDCSVKKIEGISGITDFTPNGSYIMTGSGEVWKQNAGGDSYTKIDEIIPAAAFSPSYISYNKVLESNGNLWELITDNSTPSKAVQLAEDVIGVSNVGWGSCLFLKSDHTVWACERSGNTVSSWPVDNFSDVKEIASNNGELLVVKMDGSLWAYSHRYGINIHNLAFEKILQPSNVTKLHLKNSCCFAECEDGSVWGWGRNCVEEMDVPSRYSKLYPEPQRFARYPGQLQNEYGDNFREAHVVDLVDGHDTVLQGEISDSYDEDWFLFRSVEALVAGFSLECESPGVSFHLYDTQMRELTNLDDVAYCVSLKRKLFARISYDRSIPYEASPYTLRIVPEIKRDDFSDNGALGNQIITLDAEQIVCQDCRISSNDDVDMIYLKSENDAIVHLELSTENPNLSFYLFSPQMKEIHSASEGKYSFKMLEGDLWRLKAYYSPYSKYRSGDYQIRIYQEADLIWYKKSYSESCHEAIY